MDRPIEVAYIVIRGMTEKGVILGGRVRSSINKNGLRVCVWMEADQIIGGRKIKNVHLRNPLTHEDIVGRADITNGCMDPAFTEACEKMLAGINRAMIDHERLLKLGHPTWGHNYSLPPKGSSST